MTAPPHEFANPPITQYWHSRELPDEIATLTGTFRDHDPDLPHRVFCREDAERFIAGHLSTRELEAFRACAVPAMQADYFRYCAVYVLGGLYVDAYRRCGESLRPLFDRLEGGELFAHTERVDQRGFLIVVNGFFAFRSPGHPLLALALALATANIEARIVENVWFTTGPAIYTSLNLLRELGSFDALLRKVEGTKLRLTSSLLCEVVGEPAVVEEAFDDVRISPVGEAFSIWCAPPGIPLPYKRHSTDWRRHKSSIFR